MFQWSRILLQFINAFYNPFTPQAIDFFTGLANETYGGIPYKNEPGDTNKWPEIKAHAVSVIQAIRLYDPDNIILVPGEFYGQQFNAIVADGDFRGKYSNIAYTLHFYTASHKQGNRDQAQYALDNGLAIFCTEWGVGDYTGNGQLDSVSCMEWLWIIWIGISSVGQLGLSLTKTKQPP